MALLHVFFDGAYSQKGVAAYGFIVKNAEMDTIVAVSGRVGTGRRMSCVVSEYEALYQAMLYVVKHFPKDEVEFNGDSTLVIRQMRGESKARSGKYIPYYEKTLALAEPFIERKLWRFRWIQRALNSEADDLAQYHRY